jgi:carbohydrate-selective porin OprB
MKTNKILTSKIKVFLKPIPFLPFLTMALIVFAGHVSATPPADTNAVTQRVAESKNPQTVAALSDNSASSILSQWWNGSSALGNWFGLGNILSDHGLTITGSAKESYFGQVSGGYFGHQPNSNWVNEEKLNALLNFGRLLGVDALDGLTFSSTWRYRNVGRNPGFVSGTAGGPSSTFNPSADTSGLGMRILPQYLQYSTPNKSFTINAGWENPYEQFLQQPLSKDFQNNNITSAKGIGASLGGGIPYFNAVTIKSGTATTTTQSAKFFNSSSVPWSSSYASWGGTVKVDPTRDTYIMGGLYEAITQVNGISATQFSATQVYPYTQVPSSLAGSFNSTGLVYQKVGANGQPLYYQKTGKPVLAAVGFIPGYNQNHGFNFQGSPAMTVNNSAIGASSVVGGASAPSYGSDGGYNSMNGLYNVNEVGWTPKFGADKLAGHYAIGGYIWGQENTSYQPTSFAPESITTTTAVVKGKTVTTATYSYIPYNAKTPYPTAYNNLQWGMYFQADQQLYRVKEDPAADGKDTVPASGSAKLSDKGLYTFNEFTFTTPQNVAMPFYFQTGLVYKGLIPHRDNDQIGVALGAGFYSSYYNQYIQAQNQSLEKALGSPGNATVPDGPTSTGSVGTGTTGKGSVSNTYVFYGAYLPAFSSTEVIEAYYKIQINKWATFTPDIQYIINPEGNATLGNEWILGAYAKVIF